MASRGDKGNGNGEEQIVEVNRYGLDFCLNALELFCLWVVIADAGGSVPVLHLYGEAGGCTPMPSLLEAVLLCVREAMADGAALPVSALQGFSAPARARQLPLGRGGHPANWDHAANQLGYSKRKLPWQVYKHNILSAIKYNNSLNFTHRKSVLWRPIFFNQI